MVRGKKGTHVKLLSGLVSEGFVRVRVDGEIRDLNDNIELNKNKQHDIEVVVDRLVKKEGIEERLVDSLTTCLKRSEGIAIIDILADKKQAKPDLKVIEGGAGKAKALRAAEKNGTYDVTKPGDGQELPSELVFSENFACPEHGAVMDELSPRLFSFNSPYGACPTCHGLGSLRTFSEDLVVPDPSLPVYAAIAPWSPGRAAYRFRRGRVVLCRCAQHPATSPHPSLDEAPERTESVIFPAVFPSSTILLEPRGACRDAFHHDLAPASFPGDEPGRKTETTRRAAM